MDNCINFNTPEGRKFEKDFGRVTVTNLVNKYFSGELPSYDVFISNKAIGKELGFLPKSALKNEIGKTYSKNISSQQVKNLRNEFFKFNNRLLGYRYETYNVKQIGQADLFTWDFRKIEGNVNLENKLERAKARVIDPSQSTRKISELERLKSQQEKTIISRYGKNNNVSSILNKIINDSDANPVMKQLASHLIKLSSINDIKITIYDKNEQDLFIERYSNEFVKNPKAYHSSLNNEIRIIDDGRIPFNKTETVILHEVIHALSWKEIREDSNLSKDFDEYYNHVLKYFETYNPEQKKGEYALSTKDEFFVALFTDSKFITKLERVPPLNKKYKNLFEEIFDKILNVLGINKSDNFYNEAFSLATNILSQAQEKIQSYSEQEESSRDISYYNGDETLMEQEEGFNPFSDDINEEVSSELIKLIKDFIKQIGVDYQKVDKIVVDGKILNENGVARMLQKLIQVVDGKESETLPEEAMHFAVEIIEQTNPQLFKKLLNGINGERSILNQVIAEYGTNPYYQKDGKPNITKLKKEAIARVLVNKLSNSTANNWWQQIINHLKKLFFGTGIDELALKILSGEYIGTADDLVNDEIYFQLNETKQDKIVNTLKNISSRIEKNDDGLDDEGNPRQSYFIDGKKIKYRVTDFVKEWYQKIFGKDVDQTDFQKSMNDLRAEKGTLGHLHFETALNLFVDPDTNLLREQFLEDDPEYVGKLSTIDRDIYDTLKDNLRERVLSFPEGTKFLSEIVVYNGKNTAGTIDFLAITPEGKVNILDWKFMDLNVDKYEDVPWYKVAAWNMQMEKYKHALTSMYGVTESDFGQTRMIPILAVYEGVDYKNEILPVLKGIKIGAVDVQNINEDYLLPVGVEMEKTGVEELDTLIEKFNNIYSKLSKEKVNESEKAAKAEQLNELYRVIRHLQIKQDVIPLLKQGKVLNKQVENFIKKYNNEIKDKEKGELSKEKINAFAGMLRVHIEALIPYTELRVLEEMIGEENEELRKMLDSTIGAAQSSIIKLQKIDKEFGKKFIGASYTAEKVVQGLTKFFGNMATIQINNLQTLFKLVNEATAISNFELGDQIDILTKLEEKYKKWAESKGLKLKNYFDIIKKKDKNELIDQYDKTFYTELKKAVAKRDFDWILDNIDRKKAIDNINKIKEKKIQSILSKPRATTIELAQAEINREIAKVERIYDVSSRTSQGWLLLREISFPLEKWESKEWKELNKPENAPAKEFYDYIVERNKYFQEIGYLAGKSARVFLPWVQQGITEALTFGNVPDNGIDRFLRSISIDEHDVGYGEIDPITKKPIEKIPTPFLREFDGNYSTNLFSTMALYNQYAIKFKNLSDIEEQARLLLRAEENKKSLKTSMFSKIQKKVSGGFIENENNDQNAKLVETFIKSAIYQQKYANDEGFDVILAKVSGFGKDINKKLGVKIFPENLEPRYVSLNKSIDQLNRMYQLNTLGLNMFSSISNMFGGTANALINSGKYMTKLDYMKAQANFIYGKLQQDPNANKILAAIDYFMPFVDNYNRDASKKLSLVKISPEQIQDFLMIGLKKGDELIQYMNAFSFVDNMIVIDGQVKNVREYLRTTDEYKDFYAGTSEERSSRKEKFEKDVDKLLETNGLLKLSELSEEGKLVIPGVDRVSESVITQRRIIQQFTSDTLGSLTEENRRLVNMNVYTNSAMVFKNWIPSLADVRLGDMKYNAAYDSYEWGRYRTVFKVVFSDLITSMRSLMGMVSGDDSKWIEQVNAMFEKQKKDYFESTGKDLKMTSSEFISLVNRNIKNQALDVVILATLGSILMAAKAFAPDDDEDPSVRNQYKLGVRVLDKLTDEIIYFYDPRTPFNLISSNKVFPSLGLLENYIKFIKHFMLENYGIVMEDEELIEKSYPIKYLLKSFPITSSLSTFIPVFSPEMAKDLGIRAQSTYGVR